jgi:Flp pilus assembly protein TadG
MALAVVSMVTMLGALSMVIDAGVYFVVKAQLQNAADAAALAAVWYTPACPSTWQSAGCQASYPNPDATNCSTPSGNVGPCSAAEDVVRANWSVALSLCSGPKLAPGTIPVTLSAHPGLPPNFSDLVVPSVTPYVVTLDCQAPHWFARFIPGVNLIMDINANATAALGWRGPSGELLGDPRPVSNPPLVARLIL